MLTVYSRFLGLPDPRRTIRYNAVQFVGHVRRWIAEDPGLLPSTCTKLVTFDRVSVYTRSGHTVTSQDDIIPDSIVFCLTVWDACDG